MFSDTLHIEIQTPLWKMDFNPEQIRLVKESLQVSYNRNHFARPGKEDKLNALICFAEWWREEYSGEAASKMDVVRFVGLPEESVDALYSAAKGGLSLLRIKIIHSPQNYQLRFRTMLLQGGIPKNLLFGDNNSRFRTFLSSLLEELHDKVIDWEDETIVEELNCQLSLPLSFRKEDIYALGLQIVHAVIEDRDDLLPFDATASEFQSLIENLKRKLGSMRKNKEKPIGFQWDLEIKDGEGILYYTVDNIKIIPETLVEGIDQNVFQFNLEVSGNKVATYRKSHQGFVRLSLSKSRFKWNKESYLDVSAVTHGLDSFPVAVAKNFPPDFETPQVFNLDGARYVQKNNVSSESIVIFNEEFWQPTEGTATPLRIAGDSFGAIAFRDKVELRNIQTGKTLPFENHFTDYYCVFKGLDLGWIDSANYPLINSVPRLEVYSDEGLVSNKAYKVQYRKRGMTDWVDSTGRLPNGYLKIRVVFNDLKWSEQTFYNIDGLDFSFTDQTDIHSTITSSCRWGRVFCHNREGILIRETRRDVWSLSRIPDVPMIPDKIYFTVKEPSSPDLILSLPCPFNLFCLEDKTNNSVATPRECISLNDLDRYAIIQRGNPNPIIYFKYKGDQLARTSLKRTTHDVITPLSKFEATISSLLALNGHNPFNRDECVEFTVGNSTYKVRPFVLDSELTLQEDRVTLTNNDPYEGKVFACEMGDNIINGELSVKRMEQDESLLSFLLKEPPRDDCEDGADIRLPFIVFSEAADKRRIIPRLMATAEDSTRSSNTAAAWCKRLEEDDPCNGIAWREATNAFELATAHSLPYKTFNELRAVASAPSLLFKFVVAMFFNDKTEKALAGILRFEEEFAVSIHWIRPSVWFESVQYLPGNRLFQLFFGFLGNLIEVTGGDIRFLGQGPTVNSGKYVFGAQEVNELRARMNYSAHNQGGTEMPRTPIHLMREDYITPAMRNSFREEQRTLLNSPILIAEYLLEKRDDLWHDDMLEIRRVVSFYSREFHDLYNEILKKVLR